MQALQFRKSVPRYVLLKLLGSRWKEFSSIAAPIALRDIPQPRLPGPKWVRIAPRLAGICGSDLATICAKGSPYLAPITSMPFVMGHEVVGIVVQAGHGVTQVNPGDRIVLHPALGCKARGIDPPCLHCHQNRDALCSNVDRGDVSAGIQIGYCRDTGGGFGENFVAHESQAYPVPPEIDDIQAVLIEPFACALHGALRTTLWKHQTALVIGCGSIGLLTIAALRASACVARIVAVARHGHQAELAKQLGAELVLETRPSFRERYRIWAPHLHAELRDAELGKPLVIGGADAVFDCVGTSQSIDDGLRFTRSGGTLVLVGMPGIPFGVDWTSLWYKELTIRAAYAYGPERTEGGTIDTFKLAIKHMETWGKKLARLVGPPFQLRDYRAALQCALSPGRSKAVKTVFAIHPRA